MATTSRAHAALTSGALCVLLAAAIIVWAAPALRADVKTQHKTMFQMGGMLGGLMNRFAGDAAKDGAVETMSIKGTRQLTSTAQTGKIIDLSEEKVYDLDITDEQLARIKSAVQEREEFREEIFK